MSAAASSPSDGRRPLGEVLVERGIVTREQLTAALEQQRSTGRPLGEIIVALGFAPGPIIAQALATQHGGLIKTEYGFATGWSSDDAPTAAVAPEIEASELAERDRTIASLREWAEKAQGAIASRDSAIARLRAELAGAVDEAALEVLRSEAATAHDEAAAARRELEAESARHASAKAQLERELAARDEALAALRAERPTLLEAHAAEVARLDTARTELKDAAARHEAELAAARQTADELERRLENARSRSETLARRVAEQEVELEAFRSEPAAGASRWATAPTHYVMRRGAGGYDLVAHDGPPPAVGERVDGLHVARVAPVGPGFDVPCVFLAD